MLRFIRKQEGQYHDYLHTMVESQEGRKYGRRSGIIQGQQEGQYLEPQPKSLETECVLQVKRILVPQRENPIVNRLNKTKVEKFPDLAMEKEEKLKLLRKKDQATKLERVRFSFVNRGKVLIGE